MATAIQFRRGTTAQHSTFTGLVGEITVDTDLDTIRVHDGSTAGGTRLAKYSEVVAAAAGDITDVNAGSGLTGGSASGAATLAIDYENLSGNLVPSANNTYSLGTVTKVWKDVYVGPGSLYVNGQQVLSDSSGTIQFTADNNQNISILTTGSGDLEMTSGGDIQLKSDVVLTATKTITSSGGVKFGSNINMNSSNINNVDDPVAAQDAATKAYVDSQVQSKDNTDEITEGSSNLYYTNARADARIANALLDEDDMASDSATQIPSQQSVKAFVASQLATKDALSELSGDTDDVTEGSTNLYHTTARARAAISENSTQLAYDSGTGVMTFSQGNTDTVAEGSNNLYYTTARWDAKLAAASTDELSEGSNLYYTDARADARIANNIIDEDNLGSDSNSRAPSQQSVKAYVDGQTTDETAEGSSNLYFTTSRARGSISVTDSGGDGGLSYNSTSGVITYTGPSAAEVEARIDAHLVGGDGIDYSAGTVDVDATVIRTTGAQSIGGAKTFSDDAVFSGNVTISGTQTIVNSSITSLADSVLELNRDASGAPSEDAGLQVNRGSSADVQLIWDESEDAWRFTNNGSTYFDIATSTDELAEGSSNLYYTSARANADFDTRLATKDTDDLSEGSSNLYHTAARARAALSASTGVSYNSTSGAISIGQPVGTGDSVQFNDVTADLTGDVTGQVSDISNHDTADLSEGTNLYFTTSRADARAAAVIASSDSDDLSEGSSNLYFTTARAQAAISVSGDLGYSGGVVSFTERTDAEVRGLLSGGTGITYNSGTGAISLTDTGLITAVTAGTGISGGGTSGTVSVAFDGSELPDMTDAIVGGSDEMIVLDSGVSKRKLFSEITLSDFSNDAGFTTNVGDITNVSAGTGLTGGGASGSVTVNVGGGTGITVNANDIAVNMSAFDTDDLTEGSSNLYFTTARARASVSGGTGITYNSSTGAISLTDTGYVTGVTAGSGLSGGGTSGTVSLAVSGLTTGHIAAGTLLTAGESFQNSDSYLMSAAAIEDKILSYGYSTTTGDITSVAVAGTGLSGGGSSGAVTITSNATSANTGGAIVARDGSGNFSCNIMSGQATTARYADLAEIYEADADYEPGTVVKFGGEKEITASDSESDPAVVGVISTDPAHLMNSDAEGLPVALAGRVPCKVVGPVAKGDLMVSAADGRAKADNQAQAGRIIGKAISASEDDLGVVEVLVNMM